MVPVESLNNRSIIGSSLLRAITLNSAHGGKWVIYCYLIMASIVELILRGAYRLSSCRAMMNCGGGHSSATCLRVHQADRFAAAEYKSITRRYFAVHCWRRRFASNLKHFSINFHNLRSKVGSAKSRSAAKNVLRRGISGRGSN